MSQTTQNILILIVAALGVSFLFLFNEPVDEEALCKELSLAVKEVSIEENVFYLTIADTQEARTCGLSYKKEIANNAGMFFVFEKPNFYGIWMKDMHFPIDVVWLDENRIIIHREEMVSPDSYPRVFSSPMPAQYIIEFKAGTISEKDISLGDRVYLK